MKHQEYALQKAICQYLNMAYPKILYLSDLSGQKMSMPQAIRNKQIQKDGFSFPDLIIFEPRNEFHGLMIELKIESPFKKGSECTVLKKNEHIERQFKTMEVLKEKGFWCVFCWEFSDAKNIIDKYLH